jgi:AcrR family transcriptional regulator
LAVSGSTKEQIVGAAIETLRTEGFAGTSARAIARTGEFNQALIFYHFGTVNSLLLEALRETSERRMETYTAALEGIDTPEQLLRVAADVYREDVRAGHLTVLSEMIAGSSSAPELGREIAELLRPWMAFAEEAIERAGSGLALADLPPARDLAFAIVALYLGTELLTHLEGDTQQAESMFASLQDAVTTLQPFLGMFGKGS